MLLCARVAQSLQNLHNICLSLLHQALKPEASPHPKLVIHAWGKHKNMNASWELVHDRRALACRKLIPELPFAAVSASPTFSTSSAKVCTGSAHYGLISPLKSDVCPLDQLQVTTLVQDRHPFLAACCLPTTMP